MTEMYNDYIDNPLHFMSLNFLAEIVGNPHREKNGDLQKICR